MVQTRRGPTRAPALPPSSNTGSNANLINPKAVSNAPPRPNHPTSTNPKHDTSAKTVDNSDRNYNALLHLYREAITKPSDKGAGLYSGSAATKTTGQDTSAAQITASKVSGVMQQQQHYNGRVSSGSTGGSITDTTFPETRIYNPILPAPTPPRQGFFFPPQATSSPFSTPRRTYPNVNPMSRPQFYDQDPAFLRAGIDPAMTQNTNFRSNDEWQMVVDPELEAASNVVSGELTGWKEDTRGHKRNRDLGFQEEQAGSAFAPKDFERPPTPVYKIIDTVELVKEEPPAKKPKLSDDNQTDEAIDQARSPSLEVDYEWDEPPAGRPQTSLGAIGYESLFVKHDEPEEKEPPYKMSMTPPRSKAAINQQKIEKEKSQLMEPEALAVGSGPDQLPKDPQPTTTKNVTFQVDNDSSGSDDTSDNNLIELKDVSNEESASNDKKPDSKNTHEVHNPAPITQAPSKRNEPQPKEDKDTGEKSTKTVTKVEQPSTVGKRTTRRSSEKPALRRSVRTAATEKKVDDISDSAGKKGPQRKRKGNATAGDKTTKIKKSGGPKKETKKKKMLSSAKKEDSPSSKATDSQPSTDYDDKFYEVESLLGRRHIYYAKGKRGSKCGWEYLVKWKVFTTDQADWIMEKDIFHKELLAKFDNLHPKDNEKMVMSTVLAD